jgi:hypothetical protein
VNTSLTETGADALFLNPPEPPPPGFTLWYRSGRGTKWEPAFTGPTEFACVSAMADGVGGRRAGMWLVLPNGREP